MTLPTDTNVRIVRPITGVIAPEQIKAKRGNARTDIYSVGAILYEMLTGRTPLEGENPLSCFSSFCW